MGTMLSVTIFQQRIRVELEPQLEPQENDVSEAGRTGNGSIRCCGDITGRRCVHNQLSCVQGLRRNSCVSGQDADKVCTGTLSPTTGTA